MPENSSFNLINWIMGVGATLFGGTVFFQGRKIANLPENYMTKTDHNRTEDRITSAIQEMNSTIKSQHTEHLSEIRRVHTRIDDIAKN